MIKKIPGFENYDVSNDGKVFSNSYNRTGKRVELKYQKDKYGYLYVRLSIRRGKALHKTVHRLVAELFIPNLNKKTQVNHIDGNKLNNCISNLEWATPSENITHSFRILKQKPNVTNSKINYNIAQEIRKRLKDGEKGIYLAKEYGISPGDISRIKRGVIWNIER